ncbi:MAG: Mur ligase family protein [Patescibacteria group bacterium]|nr:Mur ligase family protein [Patescibacteria group bacterium]
MIQYQQDIAFIESLSNIPRQNYLLKSKDRSVFVNRTRKFLALVGSPEKKLKFIHIAGTSGKGTTTKLMEELLSKAGYKSGAFTSPFSTTSIEKISLGGKLLAPKRLHQILEKSIKPALDLYVQKFPGDQISYFECWLTIALIYFQQEKCDWVVLEAGLGGQHDASNVIPKPIVCAITNIGLDHQEILGHSKKEIAQDKAGIIKKGALFISSEKDKKLQKIFANRCQQKKARQIEIKNLADKFSPSLYFSTKGQKNNLNLALNILAALKISVSAAKIQKTIDSFHLICRQEIVQTKPLVVLDGSHNPDKLGNLLEFLPKLKYQKLHLIVGFAWGKSYNAPLKKMLAAADHVYLTRFLISERKSTLLKKMHHFCQKHGPGKNIQLFHDPHWALASALEKAKSRDLILVAGSFFLAGELRKKWQSEEEILQKLELNIRSKRG